MALATQETVQRTLDPYHPVILKIIDDAWAEVRALEACRRESNYGAAAYKRTISNDMFDAIARRAFRAFQGFDGVHIRPEAQTVKFFAGGEVLFRFKKGDDSKLGCNIPTQAALAFIEADRVVPGLPPETAKVEIIWQPNEIWTQIERVLVVARDGDRRLWEYEIERSEGGSVVFVLPQRPTPPEDDGADSLVRPKVAAKRGAG